MEQAGQKEFLEVLFEGVEGFIDIRTFRVVKIKEKYEYQKVDYFFHRIKDINELIRLLKKKHFENLNIHFGVAPRYRESGTEKDVKILRCFWCDLDCKRKNRPDLPTKEEALELIKKFKLAPSIIVDSGQGYHLYWLLSKSINIKNENAVLKLRGVLAGLSQALGGDVAGKDLSRCLRIPETLNFKSENPEGLPVKIIKLDKNITYNIKEFEPFFIKQKETILGEVTLEKEKIKNWIRDPESLELPEHFDRLLNVSRNLRETFEGDRPDLTDQSRSGYSMALASILTSYNLFTDEEIIKIMIAQPRGKLGENTPEYLIYTLKKAKGSDTSTGVEELLEDIALPKEIRLEEVDQKRLNNLLEKAIPDRGFLKDYIDIFSEITDTPKSFLFWGAMTTLSAILGKDCYVNWETRRLYPNIWSVFLAPSGFRKGTAIDIPVKLLWEIDKDLLLPSIGSEEGLTKALSIGKSGGRETGFIRWQEFAKILKGWNTRGSWVASQEFFINLWDSKPFKKKLSQEEFIVGETAVSFLGACIPASFSKHFSIEDLELGFFGRVYLITCIEKEKYIPIPLSVSEKDIKRLVKELEDIGDKYNDQFMSRELIEEDFIEWALKIYKNRERGYLNAFFSRIETHCIKLATIYEASLGGSNTISKEAFYYATRALNFLTESAKPMISETIGLSEEQRLIRDILIYIRKRKIVRRSELMKKFNLNSDQTYKIQSTLIERQSIKFAKKDPEKGSKGGRPELIYIAI
ncbi:hypothetical protein ES695_07320 [Candidatus Atribacteria bacterium 1244-E10-H5-B2]|nr:MAG: hypothetical protein ES695_07320 [Candidatus Atribacteria bacterium 1244-E10-H5-B2]